ncbi:MAG TPA: shikimate kinase [Pyrinomonadaceae bacterium]|nr:shikimate kinase [Pyrinomonadaceae bacterium]
MKPIVITGFMGCGKSKVAREVARRLKVAMIDLDERITAREGRSPAELIVEDGETAFRKIETSTLHDVLQSGEANVISLGGGAWIQEANRALIEQYGCLSLWLDTPFEVCWARIEASDEIRPLGKTRDQALALYEQRRPIYQLADVHFTVRDENFDDLLSLLTHFLERE